MNGIYRPLLKALLALCIAAGALGPSATPVWAQNGTAGFLAMDCTAATYQPGVTYANVPGVDITLTPIGGGDSVTQTTGADGQAWFFQLVVGQNYTLVARREGRIVYTTDIFIARPEQYITICGGYPEGEQPAPPSEPVTSTVGVLPPAGLITDTVGLNPPPPLESGRVSDSPRSTAKAQLPFLTKAPQTQIARTAG